MSKRNRETQTITASDVGQMPDALLGSPPATDGIPPVTNADWEADRLEWAESILADWIDERGGIDASVQYGVWRPGFAEISLDGSFTPDQLEAMAIWMHARREEPSATH